MLAKKAQSKWKLTILLVCLMMLLLVGVAGSAVAAPQPEALAQVAQHDHTLLAEEMSSQEILIMHYGPFGNPTGRLHSLSIDLYYEIIDILLASGREPSPRNIDELYDRMRG